MRKSLESWYRGRRVLITGHSGFKGSWLVAWLREAGAEITGYALRPDDHRPSLFREARLEAGIQSVYGDVRNSGFLTECVLASRAEIVFHMAAQSLVRSSYRNPVETFETNVMGTVNLLEAVRHTPNVRAVVVVTSDKCYDNDGSGRPYTEAGPMGGYDPYSASKGCTELVAAAWRRSFLAESGVAVATARAGNVIGGGDWAEDRLLPDLFQAAARGEVATLRNPRSIRPWQYVLEPLRGYLMLARALVEHGASFAEGWNFGPLPADAISVRDVAHRLGRVWPRVRVQESAEPQPLHEAASLVLDASKARERLGWQPHLTINQALSATAEWYRDAFAEPHAISDLVARELASYQARVSPSLTVATG